MKPNEAKADLGLVEFQMRKPRDVAEAFGIGCIAVLMVGIVVVLLLLVVVL